MSDSKPFHVLTRDAAFELLASTPQGLSSSEATKRLAEVGPNEIQAAKRVTAWEILLDQFKNVLILILLGAVVLSLFLGHGVESVIIAVIVLFAVVLGFVQEYRAERAIEALREMAAPTAAVMRDGAEVKIPARELVPGDVILLRTGDRIPADARLLETVNLQVEEAALTGESVPVEKHIHALSSDDLAVGDRKNMVYAGTAATYGGGRLADEALYMAAYLCIRFTVDLYVITIGQDDREATLLRERASAYLEGLGIRIVTYLERQGEASRAIVETAQASDCDLLVIGGYEGGFFGEALKGSTVDQVLRGTQRMVLVCR